MTDQVDNVSGRISVISANLARMRQKLDDLPKALRLSMAVVFLFGSLTFALAMGLDVARGYQSPPTPLVTQLQLRRFAPAVDPDVYQTEKDSEHEFTVRHLYPERTALVLIDTWAHHPNEGFMERAEVVTQDRVVPLVEVARAMDIPVVHAPHLREIHPAIEVLPDDIHADHAAITETDAFDRWLKDRGIRTLLYAGFASNWCVLDRPIGMLEMKKRGYRIILVRDASIAFETARTVDGQWAHATIVNFIEINDFTTTVDDLIEARAWYEANGQPDEEPSTGFLSSLWR